MRRSGKSPADKVRKWLKDCQEGKWVATEKQIEDKRLLLEALEREEERNA